MTHITFLNDRGNRLAGVLDGKGESGVVICSHFTGFKEVKLYYYLARWLAASGFTVLRFDYGDCIGESEGSCEDMSLTHQVRDTLSAVDWMKKRGVSRIGLFGHSLGGLTALAAAAGRPDVHALVTLASPAKPDWDTAFRDLAPDWKTRGYVTFDTWKRGRIRIPYRFYSDLKNYDGEELIKKVSAAVLVIQPGEDRIVERRQADVLYAAASGVKKRLILPGADHLVSDRSGRDLLLAACTEWFEMYLSSTQKNG